MFLENNNNINNAHKLIGIDDTVFLSHGNDHFEVTSIDSRAFEDVLRESVRDNREYACDQYDKPEENEKSQSIEQVKHDSKENNSVTSGNNENQMVTQNNHEQDTKYIKHNDVEKETDNDKRSSQVEYAHNNYNSSELLQNDNPAEVGQVTDDKYLNSDKLTPNDEQAVMVGASDSSIQDMTVTGDNSSISDDSSALELADGWGCVEEHPLTVDEVSREPLARASEPLDEMGTNPNQIMNEDACAQQSHSEKQAGIKQGAEVQVADKISAVAEDGTIADMPITGDVNQKKTDKLNNTEIFNNDHTREHGESTENNQENVLLRKDDTKPLQMETASGNSPDFSGNKNSDSFNINARQAQIENGEPQPADVNSDNDLFKNIMDIQQQFDSSSAKTDMRSDQTTLAMERNEHFFDYEKNKLFERDILQQVQAKLQLRTAGGAKYSEIRFVLKPEQLGEVGMRIVMQDNTLTAKMKVDNETVKTVLEANMEELRKSLAEQGVKVEKVEVVVKNDTGSARSFDENRSHNANTQTDNNQSRSGGQHTGQQNKKPQTEDVSEGLFRIRRQTKIHNNGKIDYLI